MTIYNEPLWMIEKSINSIIQQSYKNIELIIIVDNPEYTEAIDLLRRYKYERILWFVNESNYGLAKSLNIAASKASGLIYARMDADDESLSNRLEKELKTLTENDFDFVSSDVKMIDDNGIELVSTHVMPQTITEFEKRIRYGNCLVHPTYMYTKELFDFLGGYKEELVAAQDYEFLYHAYSEGFKIGFINDKLLKYRVRQQSISNSRRPKQLYVVYYTQYVYRNMHEYNSESVKLSLEGKDSALSDFSEYLRLTEGGDGFSKFFIQLLWFIKSKYVRNMLIDGAMMKRIIKKYH